MCSSFYLTISAIYPMYNHLIDYAKKRINNTQISEKITIVAQATWDKLKQYYNKTSDSFHYARYSNSYEELNYYLESSPEPTIPATSAPVERIFSESGNIITPERNWLGSGTIKATFTVVSVAANFAIGIFWISQYLCEFHVGAVGVA
ncbi:464_t:CDS:2 [Gigaspora rosea]|nr:464_t:CDS:2 [Gigaspora rosea]